MTYTLPLQACNVYDTFAIHIGLVHDVTNTDCWAQNGSMHGHVVATFKTPILQNQDEKASEKLLCGVLFCF